MRMTDESLLVFGKEYKLWRDEKYIGIATWTEDKNVGDSFIKLAVNETGEIVHQVFIADEWELNK